jgi:hypothetical protein
LYELTLKAKSIDCYELALDEFSDSTDTAEVMIFVRGFSSVSLVSGRIMGTLNT